MLWTLGNIGAGTRFWKPPSSICESRMTCALKCRFTLLLRAVHQLALFRRGQRGAGRRAGLPDARSHDIL